MSQHFNPFSKEAQTARSPGGKGKMSERRDGKPPQYKEESDEVVNCKRKGNAYELDRVKLLQNWFPDRNIRRSSVLQCTTGHGVPDIIGCGKWHPEAKNQKTAAVFEWIRTVLEDIAGRAVWPVILFHVPASKGYKGRASDWMICRVEDFPYLAVDFVENQREAG